MEPVTSVTIFSAIVILCFLSIIPIQYYILEILPYQKKNITVKNVEEVFKKDYENVLQELQYAVNEEGKALPLGFEKEYINLIEHLCSKYASRRAILFLKKKFTPAEETNYIGFKSGFARGLVSPFKAEMVRCDKNYAFIEAGNGEFAYLLKKSKLAEHFGKIDRDIFKLLVRFPYMEELTKMEEFEALKKIVDDREREAERLSSIIKREKQEKLSSSEEHTQPSNLQ